MNKYGFKQALLDHTMFCKMKGDIFYFLLFMLSKIEKLENYLAKDFKMKDLLTWKYLLDIEVSKKGIFSLNENKYQVSEPKLVTMLMNLRIHLLGWINMCFYQIMFWQIKRGIKGW